MIPAAGTALQFTVERQFIEEVRDRIAFAAATDESRPIFCGVVFKIIEEKNGKLNLSVAAADGFRLAVINRPFKPLQITWGEPKTKTLTAIVPANLFELAAKVIKGNEPVTFAFGTQCHITTPTAGVCSQLIEGAYPDFTRIIPERKGMTEIAFPSVNAAIAAARFVQVYAKDALGTMRLTYKGAQHEAILHAAATDWGDDARVIALTPESKLKSPLTDFVVAVNAQYLLDGLVAMSGPKDLPVTLLVNKPSTPIAITNDATHFTFVCMPMHINK